MNAFMMTLLAMMLLTASSARTLKGDYSCDTDYQPPNYWGKCVDGEYRNVDTFSDGHEIDCRYLIILVSDEYVGHDILTVKTHVNEGEIAQDLFFNKYGYYSLILGQNDNGVNVDIEFYRNGTMVHNENYQQDFCFWEAGAITTNDPSAETYEGSFGNDMPGHIMLGHLG
jgi:hypothetical protein